MVLKVVDAALKFASCVVILPFVHFSSSHIALNGTDSGTYCAFVNNKVATEPDTGEPIISSNLEWQTPSVPLSIVRCQGEHEYCYTLFYLDPTDRARHTILMQGCWDHPDEQECPESDCVARSPLLQKNIRNNTRFCCCRGNLCNVNVTDTVNLTAINIMIEESAQAAEHAESSKYEMCIIVVSLVGGFFLITILIIAVVRVWLVRRRFNKSFDNSNESDAFLGKGSGLASRSSSCGSDLDGLKFDVLINHGRYGDVYRGLLGPSEVAVKVLNATQYRCYANERDTLSLPSVQHPSIVEFRGCREERLPGGSIQYLVVTTYEPLGSLTDYLKHNTVDWATACRMCHSIAAGLAHLHTESHDGGLTKPPIVHRDVNSRNVLVRSDLTCCLCDFGFAMKIATPRLNDSGATNEDHNTLADVGTLRYMAPEVLEGSVNLCDCRMALTQVDVYALGLVFWEVGTRCHDLYQGLPTPVYQLPFEALISPHPSFEEMQVAVFRNKQRPAFPDTWKDTNVAIRSLKDTIEECWDHDAEARISSVCAEERTREMASLWETRYKGHTPTTVLKDLEERAQVQHNVMSEKPEAGSSSTADESSISDRVADISFSERPDVTTGKADCNIALALSGTVAPPWEPRNAQNPTVERNTHWSSSEELAVEGNTLVIKRPSGVPRETGSNVSVSSNDAIAVLGQAPNRLGAGRPLTAVRSVPVSRISFLQNEVTASLTPSGCSGPKRQNVPGNGRSYALDASGMSSSNQSDNRHQSEVVLVDGAASTNVRPNSLPMGVDVVFSDTRNSQADSRTVDCLSTADAVNQNAAGALDLQRNSDSDVKPQASVELVHMASRSGQSSSADSADHQSCAVIKPVESAVQPFNDNLAFESSTSPRFEDPPRASGRVW